jgi:hypothetical protein
MDIGLAVVLIAVIIFAVRHTRRVYTENVPLTERVLERLPPKPVAVGDTVVNDSVAALQAIMNSPEYQRDRESFKADLLRTGRVSEGRADSLATFAVREAYLRRVPPAVVFAVMLTENAVFESDAKSNVGAVGLMQIYPKIWLKELGKRFGTDLESDSTNIRYGVYILSTYYKPKKGETEASAWRRGLLRYNGCVRGTNTPNCKTYPNKVQNFVPRDAKSICQGKGFYDCIVRPMVAEWGGSD